MLKKLNWESSYLKMQAGASFGQAPHGHVEAGLKSDKPVEKSKVARGSNLRFQVAALPVGGNGDEELLGPLCHSDASTLEEKIGVGTVDL